MSTSFGAETRARLSFHLVTTVTYKLGFVLSHLRNFQVRTTSAIFGADTLGIVLIGTVLIWLIQLDTKYRSTKTCSALANQLWRFQSIEGSIVLVAKGETDLGNELVMLL
jgi:hypothetical protein